jgi:hypothetical protein
MSQDSPVDRSAPGHLSRRAFGQRALGLGAVTGTLNLAAPPQSTARSGAPTRGTADDLCDLSAIEVDANRRVFDSLGCIVEDAEPDFTGVETAFPAV